MAENTNFLTELENALIKKREHIELNDLPKLKELLSIFQTYFENLNNIFIRKSLIQEDPYKYDEKISEVTVPSSESFLDSEKSEQISQRLSSFHTQLEFLNNYYQFSLEFLNLKRMKNITGLIKYINWTSVTPTSSQIMTRSVGEIVSKIKMGTDAMSAQIVTDSLTQLERHTKKILALLETVIFYFREDYKVEVRRKILPGAGINPNAESTEILKTIKKAFPRLMAKKPFYPELINEVINEEYSENREVLQNDLLGKLIIKEKKTVKKDKTQEFKAILLQGVRILSSASFQMEDAINKLNDNNMIYRSRKMSLGERLSKWFQKLVGGKSDNQIYDVEFFDVTTSSTRTEKINFIQFSEETVKKAKIFASLSNKSSSAYCRLEGSTEEKIFDFLNKNINILQLIHRRLSGLNDFFRSETPKEKRGKIRSINLELNTVKNSIINSNKKKHEYVAMHEEQEQMKRLGIKVEEA